MQNDIGAFTLPPDAELETKLHVIVYDGNTSSLKEKGVVVISKRNLWSTNSA